MDVRRFDRELLNKGDEDGKCLLAKNDCACVGARVLVCVPLYARVCRRRYYYFDIFPLHAYTLWHK